VGDVIDLAACAGGDPARIGGKALGLGRLLAAGLDVPGGFVLTTEHYRGWIEANGLGAELERLIGSAGDDGELRSASARIRGLLDGVALESAAVDAAYAALGDDGAPVAVRSSATGEDGERASFAGQQDTILWQRGAGAVRAAIVRCWSSLFTAEAISYRRRLGLRPQDAEMAVVVQRMVEAEAAGVMFTLDPRTGDPSQIAIESAHGLGVSLVAGELTPDRFTVDKVTLEIRTREIAEKPFADRAGPGGVTRHRLDAATARASSLADEEVVRVAELGRRAERALRGPADVEWALGPGPGGARHPFLLQARPETAWRSRTPATPAGPTTALQRIAAGVRRGG
jgi:phosphoenolpyruvate synthase/pyruvate phosphate dikinase